MKANGYAQELFVEGSYAFSKGDYEKSASSFTEALQHDPANELVYLSRGVAYAKMGNTEQAKADFDKAVELNPANARAYHFRGLAKMKLGEHEEAVKDFDKAIELDHNCGVAYYSRGTAHSELNNERQAGSDMAMAARLGEANLQAFADDHNIWRTEFDKVEAEIMGERERDWAVTPDLRSWLE